MNFTFMNLKLNFEVCNCKFDLIEPRLSFEECKYCTG